MEKAKKNIILFTTRELAVIALIIALISLFVFVPINIGGLKLGFIPLLVIIIAVELFGFKIGLCSGVVFGIASVIANYIMPSGVFSIFFQNPVVAILPRVMIPVTCYLVYKGLGLLGDKLFKEKKQDKYILEEPQAKEEPQSSENSTDESVVIEVDETNIAMEATNDTEKPYIFKHKRTAREAYDYVTNIIAGAVAVTTNTFLVFGFVCAFFVNSSNSHLVYSGVEYNISVGWLMTAFMSNFLVEILICSLVAPTVVWTLQKAIGVTRKKRSR